jgi:hypothetical protein
MAAVSFRLPRTRNPLLKMLSAMLGVVVVGATLLFGFFIIVALAAVGGAIWLARQAVKPKVPATAQSDTHAPPPPPPGVIEGEFVVVREPARRG